MSVFVTVPIEIQPTFFVTEAPTIWSQTMNPLSKSLRSVPHTHIHTLTHTRGNLS